jgi:hypothetical protein
MPSTLTERYDFVCERLERFGRPALAALGGAPERPVVASGGADPALVGALAVGPRENREGEREPSGVVYEELATAASAIAAEMGPSPAALAETEEELAARTNWRKNGKVFLPSSGEDGDA